MKILLIDVNCKFSSTGRIVYDLYTKINESGNVAAIAYGRGKNIKENNVYKFGLDLETNFHALLTRITGYMGYYSHFSTKRLKKYINSFKPDIIHIHELHSYFVNVPEIINFIKEKEIPIVWTHHCEWLYTGKCGYAYDCNRWMTNCGCCPELKSYPVSWFFDHTTKMLLDKRNSINGFSNFTSVFPSEWLANRARKSYINEYPIKVINNGIDTDIFHKNTSISLLKKLGINNNQKIVLSVAPNILSERKGGKYAVEVARKMEYDSQIIFIIVGVEGNEIIKEKNIIFVPELTSKKELAEYYSIADVFLICSKCENFPTTCIEAQCCGCTVVGFDVGGTKETVKFGEKYFADHGDIDNLEILIKKAIINNKDNTEKNIIYYSKKRMFDDYYSIYKNITNKM